MPIPKEVTSHRIFDDVRFELLGPTIPITVLEYTIDKHGPFRHEFLRGEFSDSAAERVLTEKVRMLRSLGSIT